MPNSYGASINFYTTTLNGAVSASSTYLPVYRTDAGGTNLNANTYLVIEPENTNAELVYVTAVNTTTKVLTVTRGIGTSSGVTHADGSKIVQVAVGATFEDLQANLKTNVDTEVATLTSLATVGTAGNAAGNAGTATTMSRSDHIHNFAVGTLSRTSVEGTGDQAVTGIGFKPICVICEMQGGSGNTFFASFGFGTASNSLCRYVYNYDQGAGEYRIDSTFSSSMIQGENSASSIVSSADLKTFDSDGFTITWSVMTVDSYVNYIVIG